MLVAYKVYSIHIPYLPCIMHTFPKNLQFTTVVLACAEDGSKLKPLIIFKRKTMRTIQNKHGVIVAVQEKGWIDCEIMKIWIEKVWYCRIGSLSWPRSCWIPLKHTRQSK